MSINNFKIEVFLLFLVLLISFTFTACSSTENEAEFVEEYYENLKYGKYEEAYNMLSQASKDNISIEDYEKYHMYLKDLEILEEYKIDKDNIRVEDYNDPDDEIKYKGAIYVPVNLRVRFSCGPNKGKISSTEITYILINDGILWKGDTLLAENLSQLYAQLALFKLSEENADLEEVLQLTQEALKEDDTNYDMYRIQYKAYFKMQKFDDALKCIDKYISQLKLTDIPANENLTDEQKKIKEKTYKYLLSNALVDKALVMETPEQAKVYIQEALSVDPENQWAADCLAELEKIM